MVATVRARLAVLLVVGVVMVGVSVLWPTPASAAPVVVTEADQFDEGAQQPTLPLFRWLSSTSGFHHRINVSVFNPQSVMDLARRNVTDSQPMVVGNTVWGVTTMFVEAATQFDLVDTAAAGVVDNAAGELGQRITDNPTVLSALVVLMLVTLMWKLSRSRASGASALTEVIKHVAVVAAVVVMVNGAMNTTFDEGANEVEYGTGSPGWVVSSLNSVISTAAGTLTSGFAASADMPEGQRGLDGSFGCFEYTKTLEQQYADAAASSSEASTTLALNGMWKLTGLEAWQTSQFGGGDEGRTVFCRLLEQRAGVTAKQQARIVYDTCLRRNGAASAAVTCTTNTTNVDQSLAFGATNLDDGSATAVDVSLVGWAVCAPTGSQLGESGGWESRWVGFHGNDEGRAGKLVGECDLWWSAPSDNTTWWTGSSALNIGSDAKDVFEVLPGTDATSVSERQFLYSLHGNSAAGSVNSVAPMVYVLSAFLNLAAFGMAAGLIFIAKLMTVVFMVVLFVVLLASLFPGTESDVVARFFRQFLGMTFISFGYSILLSLMVLISAVMIRAVVAVSGAGSIAVMLMSGVAPLLAWIALGMVFKNIFRIQNPLSLKGGLAYAGVAGAMGGAVSGWMSRAGSRAGQVTREALAGGSQGGGGSRSVGSGVGGQSMGSAVPDPVLPEGAGPAEVLAARDHAQKQQQSVAAEVQLKADAAAAEVLTDRVDARGGAPTSRDQMVAFLARQRVLHEQGQQLAGGRPVRVLSRAALGATRVADTLKKPKMHASAVMGAAAAGNWEAARQATTTATQAAVSGAAQVAKRASERVVRATADGVKFAAQHPLRAAGRAAAGAAIAATAVIPGALPLAAAGVVAAGAVHRRNEARRQADPRVKARQDADLVRQYRADKAAAAETREGATEVPVIVQPEPLSSPREEG